MASSPGQFSTRRDRSLKHFDVEVFNGSVWMSLNDGLNYRVGAQSLADSKISRRRYTAQSPYYDGVYESHNVIEQQEETLEIQVYGGDQNQVSENILALQEAFGQLDYRVRLTMDSAVTTWRCQAAEWSVNRSHVYAHNSMAIVNLIFPRFPKATEEVNL